MERRVTQSEIARQEKLLELERQRAEVAPLHIVGLKSAYALIFLPALLGLLVGLMIESWLVVLVGLAVGVIGGILLELKYGRRLQFYFDHADLFMQPSDKRGEHPAQLREALALRRYVEGVPGQEAEKERARLDADIKALRTWPRRRRDLEGDRLIEARRGDLEQMHQIITGRLEAFEETERQVTEGVSLELNPAPEASPVREFG
jgi:hypothetical protein